MLKMRGIYGFCILAILILIYTTWNVDHLILGGTKISLQSTSKVTKDHHLHHVEQGGDDDGDTVEPEDESDDDEGETTDDYEVPMDDMAEPTDDDVSGDDTLQVEDGDDGMRDDDGADYFTGHVQDDAVDDVADDGLDDDGDAPTNERIFDEGDDDNYNTDDDGDDDDNNDDDDYDNENPDYDELDDEFFEFDEDHHGEEGGDDDDPEDDNVYDDDDALEGQDDNVEQKPYLILHVGPPKTATTTLQTDLAQYIKKLTRDDYDYAGRFYFPYFRNGRLVPGRQELEIVKESVAMFKSKKCEELNAGCLDHFKELLVPFKERGRHVLMSDEALAGNLHAEELTLMQQELGQEWKIIVAVGYRRFFDWLKSNHFQVHRLDAQKEKYDNWAGEKIKLRTGRGIDPLFPDAVQNWRAYSQYNKFTTHTIEDAAVAGVQVNVLDLTLDEVTGDSVRTNFLCNTLPAAPHACKASKREDAQVDEELHMNTREKSLHFNYDAIVMAAAEAGLIDTTQYRRKDIRVAMQDYNTEDLKRSHFDFALKCPTQAELDAFLDESLELELQVFGPIRAKEMEAAHRAAFQARVDAKDYCQPDVDVVLQDKTWQDFFANYAG